MPLLVEYQQKGYPIVLLNAGEDPGAIQAFLQQTGLSARVFLDSAGLQRAFQVSGLPATWGPSTGPSSSSFCKSSISV
jgi:hypothetical protein